jgi:ABC-2 type transport system permease protein
MRSRRSGGALTAPRAATSTLPLAAVGHPAFAILWKNMLCLRRTTQLRLFIGPAVMSLALGAAASSDGGDFPSVVAMSALALAAMLLIFGGRLIRNDLRQDMRHLALLKTLPIAPGELMLAEVASATLPMAAVQVSLLVIAYVAAAFSNSAPLAPSVRLGVLLAAPFAVLALNGALLTIQNGIAVLFPAWIRLGPAMNTGVEALGQNVLATMANLVSLAVALALPALVAFLAVGVLGQPPAIALALVIIVAAVILAAETYGVLRLLGRALAKAEPFQTT